MAFVIDRVDLLAYAASDARVRDAGGGTLSVPLAIAAANYPRETVPEANAAEAASRKARRGRGSPERASRPPCR